MKQQVFFRIAAYFEYWRRAKGAHSIHSPFVFELYNEVIISHKMYYAFEEIENLRTTLLRNYEKIKVQDYGAGPSFFSRKQRSISSIVRYSAASPKKGQLLFKLVNFFQPNAILEFGTSVGISTLYLHLAKRKATLITVEADSYLARLAQAHFCLVGASIESKIGNLDTLLPQIVLEIPKIDFVYFDANHRYESTLHYFETCLPKVHNETVFVLDDIYWSVEMKKAWQTIQHHPLVTMTIDLFDIGIVFFRKQQAKQHFVLKW
ncbi:MAG: class I SAM-dependent methyltransferase [Cytophagales bacterium]|nr:class I SAM-dependent methyltransferase [Cytophagales bacterium]MDW8385193.1 class I SAM-dependent methyltransferase [Flammeovirgaceae bacterium]